MSRNLPRANKAGSVRLPIRGSVALLLPRLSPLSSEQKLDAVELLADILLAAANQRPADSATPNKVDG